MTTTAPAHCPSHAAQRLCPPGCCSDCDNARKRLVPVTEAEAAASHWFYAAYYFDDDLTLCWALPRHPLPAQCVAPYYMAGAAVECGLPVARQMEMVI